MPAAILPAMSSDPVEAPVAADEPYGHLRAAPRDSMFLLARMRRPDGDHSPIKVRNLSAGGMMAEVELSYSRGEAVACELRGIGEVAGRVAWVAGPRVGIAFDREIDPKLARKPVATGPVQATRYVAPRATTMWRPPVR